MKLIMPRAKIPGDVPWNSILKHAC